MGNAAVNQLTEVTGMILAAAPAGEYDKRVVILTKEHGKISAFAKGARRPQSQLAGVTSPCTFGVFQLYQGRSSYTIHSAEISNYFSELRMDVEAACYGFYFLEFADYFTKEENDERQMLKLLYQTMRALTAGKIPLRLIRDVFELKAMYINGEGPQVFGCVSCQSKTKPCRFSVRYGGLICDTCGREAIDRRTLHTSTLYAMQFIAATPVEKLYTFTLSEEVLKELTDVIGRYLEVYVNRRFKSLEILEQMVQ